MYLSSENGSKCLLLIGIHWLTMVLVSQCWTREVSSLVPGPVQYGQGAREPSPTPLLRRESSIASLCRDTKALCRGRRGCVLESSHALATQHRVFWDDTELPENTVCNIAFLSIVLIGTSSGSVLLIISSHLSQSVSTGLLLLSATARAGTVDP